MSTPIANVVSGTPEPAVTPPAVTQPVVAAPTAEDIAAIKAENETLKGQVTEKDRATQFWYDKATMATKSEKPEKPAAEEEEDVDLLDLITTKGVKGFDALMKKRGYVSRDEVEATVNSKAAQLTTENELLGQYPDLRKQDSDFFKATAANYGDLVKQGVPQALAMKLAAEQSELQGIKSGKVKTPLQKTEDAKTQKEQERLARIKAQGGDRSPRGTDPDEDDDELTAHEKHICAAMGITEDAFKARAKKGVQMGGKGR